MIMTKGYNYNNYYGNKWGYNYGNLMEVSLWTMLKMIVTIILKARQRCKKLNKLFVF